MEETHGRHQVAPLGQLGAIPKEIVEEGGQQVIGFVDVLRHRGRHEERKI